MVEAKARIKDGKLITKVKYPSVNGAGLSGFNMKIKSLDLISPFPHRKTS